MGTMRSNWRGRSILAALSLAVVTGACSTVSQEDMDTGLAALRADMMQEMRDGDDAVSRGLDGRIAGVERATAALESDLERMERDFQVSIQRLGEELRFNVPVYFAFDDATLEDEDQDVLDRFGLVAQRHYPDALITVEGFTDQAGTEEYNLALGLRRSTAVAEYLVASASMARDGVRAVSYGENTERLVMPADWGPGAPGWQNRRVVLVIDHDGEAPSMPTALEGEGN